MFKEIQELFDRIVVLECENTTLRAKVAEVLLDETTSLSKANRESLESLVAE